jgi:hypothetical protein
MYYFPVRQMNLFEKLFGMENVNIWHAVEDFANVILLNCNFMIFPIQREIGATKWTIPAIEEIMI